MCNPTGGDRSNIVDKPQPVDIWPPPYRRPGRPKIMCVGGCAIYTERHEEATHIARRAGPILFNDLPLCSGCADRWARSFPLSYEIRLLE